MALRRTQNSTRTFKVADRAVLVVLDQIVLDQIVLDQIGQGRIVVAVLVVRRR
jgi:hypothetical protein